MGLKPVEFLGRTKKSIKEFPAEARRRLGAELLRLQEGKQPADSRPMPTVGLGVYEIRIHSAGEYRAIYIAAFKEAIYVLTAFEKKSQHTATRFIVQARTHYVEIRERRKRQ
jgi:phage-related protein